jgi:phage terminase Nu1 subunit (DNA packaging protein)
MAENDEGTITADVAARLIMVESGAFDQLVRRGWFKPVGVRRYKLVDVVQGYIKSMQHEVERGRSQAEVAAHIDMGARRFQELLDEGVIPRQKTTSYNLDDVRQTYIRHLRALAAGQGTGGGITLAGERALLAREQRETATLRNAVSRGDFVSLAKVERKLIALFSVMREQALTLPGKSADALQPHSALDRGEIFDVLHAEVCEMLENLSVTDVTSARAKPVDRDADADGGEKAAAP